MYPERFRELLDARATANTHDILFDAPIYSGGTPRWMAALTAEIVGSRPESYMLYTAKSDEHSGVFISRAQATGENGRGDAEIAGVMADTKAMVRWQEGEYAVAVCIGEVVIEASGWYETPGGSAVLQ